ncbi:MAG TPA: hypothetical protein VHS06_08540, partial [Chloroflexota bacterium]|nr:hypothetical protein [Chloroflexota bacterium]
PRLLGRAEVGDGGWGMGVGGRGGGETRGHGGHGDAGSTKHPALSTQNPELRTQNPSESPWVMTAPLVILAIPSILSGFWGSPLASGGGFAAFLEGHAEASGPNLGVMAASIVVALSGIWLAWLMYGKRSLSPERISAAFGPVYQVLSHRYWVDELYNGFVRVVVLGVAKGLRLFDVHVVDGAVNGVARITGAAGSTLRQFQTGRLQSYGWAMYAGASAIAVVTIAAQLSR